MSVFAKDNDVTLSHSLEIMTAGAPPAPMVIQNMEHISYNFV